MVTPSATLADIRSVLEAVPDPELPVLTLGQLGVVRDVRLGAGSHDLEVELTPTYSGCPAVEVMAADLRAAAGRLGFTATVRVVLSPAWSTDWITDQGRKALADNGIAPPASTRAPAGPVAVVLGRSRPARSPACPQCASREVEELSRFGSTPCLSMWRCLRCREPFDHVKTL